MNEIASQAQLRMSYVRWALFTVPAIIFLGFLAGGVAGGGYGNRWFTGLVKPGFMPPASLVPIAWGVLYALLGLALAVLLHARGARLRFAAIGLFLVQLIASYAWFPLFFRSHMVSQSFWLMLFIIVAAAATMLLSLRVRRGAALLMLPWLAWLVFMAALVCEIDRLNPEAATMVVPVLKTRI